MSSYWEFNGGVRASAADRERAVGVLRAAFTEGRLTQDELDDRVTRAYAARTYGDLWTLVADLPAGPLPYPGGVPYQQATPAVPPSAEPDTSWHSAAALVITALVIFTLAALVTAIATAHAIVLVRIVRIDISCSRLFADCGVVPAAAHTGFMKSPAPILAAHRSL